VHFLSVEYRVSRRLWGLVQKFDAVLIQQSSHLQRVDEQIKTVAVSYSFGKLDQFKSCFLQYAGVGYVEVLMSGTQNHVIIL
jgi:hypothetical protein